MDMIVWRKNYLSQYNVTAKQFNMQAKCKKVMTILSITDMYLLYRMHAIEEKETKICLVYQCFHTFSASFDTKLNL